MSAMAIICNRIGPSVFVERPAVVWERVVLKAKDTSSTIQVGGGRWIIRRPRSLRANDVETITHREFTLEGRGRNIAWLCPRVALHLNARI
jgi:hypothetical protein